MPISQVIIKKKTLNLTRICLILVFLTIIAYWQVKNCDFINFDDPAYVQQNSYVQNGFSWNSIKWAFSVDSIDRNGNWHPITWLSLMLDSELFGLNASCYHLTNLLFHILNTLLIFLIFHRMTKAIWQSAFVAALFAIHPLHVESVAWITERKDVLSTFFWMLTMGSYVLYTEHKTLGRYFIILVFFIIGLMAKSMLVTLPFVLILLDYWPLNRFQATPSTSDRHAIWAQICRLAWEKVPFSLLSGVFAAITFVTQRRVNAIHLFFPLAIRIGNALRSYVIYILKMLWPWNLAVFYPYPKTLPILQIIGAVFILAGISAFVLWMKKKSLYLLFGWLWYLGTLLPVIGIIQVGDQAYADRYTYIPLIGIFIMICWSIPVVMRNLPHRQTMIGMGAGAIIIILMTVTRIQVGYWKDTETIMEHALTATRNNPVAHLNLGHYLMQRNRYEEAITQYNEASRINPKDPEPYNGIGTIMFKSRRYEDALRNYKESIEIQPNYLAYYNLGSLLDVMKRNNEAIEAYKEALEIKPDGIEAHADLGWDLYYQGRMVEAEEQLKIALKIKPQLPEHQMILAFILIQKKELDEASQHLRLAVQYKPDLYQAHYVMGQIAMAQGDYNQAIKHYQYAIHIQPDFERARNELANIMEHQKKAP